MNCRNVRNAMNHMVVMLVACVLTAQAEVVAFKDAAKIKSWDAWNDHKKPAPPKERPSVTWAKLNSLDPGMKEIGRLAVRGAKAVKSSKWSVGCETMDRDYADWNAYKAFLEPLGAKHGRLFSGWAKTEQEKGKYDFAWLDPQVREMAAMGVKPWICLSYGNPVYGSDFRLGMRVKQVTDNPEAFEAWLRYCTACVERYKDVVDEWEIWNEPFNQGPEYAEMFYRTAKAIRAVQPAAKCFCTAITFPGDYKCVLEKLKTENALDLGSYFIFHPYVANPDSSYASLAEPLRRLVKGYSGAFDIMQGEVGCPSQLEFAHALSKIEWTEYSQAKWDLRRAIGDAARSIPSSVFTMIDLQYTFMLQSFGLIRSNALKEFVYRRPSYYAMQNVYAIFDDDMLPQRHQSVNIAGRDVACSLFSRLGQRWRFYWFCGERPSSDLSFTPVDLDIPERLNRPVWVDMITGRVFEIPGDSVVWKKDSMTLRNVPLWDSPVAIASRRAVTLARDWHNASPRDIVDSFYRPGQFENRMKAFPGPHTNEAWLSMKTADFLPCIDRYGQFRHRDWPGKTKGDDDLRRAAAEEEKDLAAHPGPADRGRFGGWKGGPQLEATGRFRTHKDESGKWWLVDPEGRLFWSFGPVRVSASSGMTPMNGDNSTPRTGVAAADRDCLFAELPPAPGAADATPLSKFWTTHDDLLLPLFLARGETRIYDFSSANLYRKYGDGYYAKFSDLVHRRLRSWGANTIANSSDLAICLMDRTPYAERVECQSRPIAGSHGMWWKIRDPWDDSFAKGVTAALEAHGREAHDPWCIGFFVDNEVNWGGPADIAKWIIQSPADQPAKAALADWLEAKYGSFAALNAKWGSAYADRADFMGSVALPGDAAQDDLHRFSSVAIDEYFRRTREAVKAFDPQLLYLGCRFAGRAREEVVESCAKHCDVVSYNIYRETIGDWRLPKGIDAPVVIGEFHFGATDRGPFGTGVRQAENQADRAEKLKAYVRSALDNPQIVGVHWHQFSDQATTGRFDGEYLQVGLTDICDTPYPEAVAAMREVGGELYARRAAPKSPLKVGVYADKGPGGIGAVEWFRLVSQSPDMELRLLDGERVRAGGLDGLDLLVMPGGDSRTEFTTLGTNGVERMKAFIRGGGGYIGTCAGCCLLMDEPGRRARMMPWARSGFEDVTMFPNISLNAKGAAALGLKEGLHVVRYHGGPFMWPTTNLIEGAKFEEWGTMEAEATFKGRVDRKKRMYGSTAVVGGTYGKGRVFVTTVHPEYFDSTLYFIKAAFRYVTGRDVEFKARLRKPRAISVGFLVKGIGGVEIAETALAVAAERDFDMVLIDVDGIFQRRLDNVDVLVVPSDLARKYPVLKSAIRDFAARGGKVVGFGTGKSVLPEGGVPSGSGQDLVRTIKSLF